LCPDCPGHALARTSAALERSRNRETAHRPHQVFRRQNRGVHAPAPGPGESHLVPAHSKCLSFQAKRNGVFTSHFVKSRNLPPQLTTIACLTRFFIPLQPETAFRRGNSRAATDTLSLPHKNDRARFPHWHKS